MLCLSILVSTGGLPLASGLKNLKERSLIEGLPVYVKYRASDGSAKSEAEVFANKPPATTGFVIEPARFVRITTERYLGMQRTFHFELRDASVPLELIGNQAYCARCVWLNIRDELKEKSRTEKAALKYGIKG